MKAALYLCASLVLGGCGADRPVARRDHETLQRQVEDAEMALPSPPPDAIVGDGFGATRREAIQDARRAVIEQLSAEITLNLRAEEREINGEGSRESEVRVQTRSAFDHLELVRTVGVVARPAGFAARAALRKREGAKVYADEMEVARDQIRKVLPMVEQAIADGEPGVLLNVEFSPGMLMARQAQRARILALLGRPAEARRAPELVAMEARAAVARRQVTVWLEVAGEVPAALRRAAVGEVERLFKARGCSVREHVGGEARAEGWDPRLQVETTLRLTTRHTEEAGLKWRYLGLELTATSALSGQTVLRFSGTPDLVHGGGRTWAQAERAVAKKLAERLPKRAGAAFAGITCR